MRQLRKEKKELAVFFYIILGYWAVGRTIFKNYIMVGTFTSIIIRKVIVGFFLGWILIPIAIISTFIEKN